MTSLAPSPVMVSLVQAASMLPVFLFALPGGALADILDRRLTLIAAQIWIAAAGLLLAALAALGLLGAWDLLALTFMIGAGTAVIFPGWAAATPELVPNDDVVQAIALNGVGFNVARALGPALGGFAMAAAGPAATFSLNALLFLALLWALLAWRRPVPPGSDLPWSVSPPRCAPRSVWPSQCRSCARPSCEPAHSFSLLLRSGPFCRLLCARGSGSGRRPSVYCWARPVQAPSWPAWRSR
jgi:MFS family permease